MPKYLLKLKPNVVSATNIGLFLANKIESKDTAKQVKISEDPFYINLEDLCISEKENTSSSSIADKVNFVPNSEKLMFDETPTNTTVEEVDFNNIHTSTPHKTILDDNHPLILNGYRIDMKPYFLDKSFLSLKFINTCPFDTIFEMFTTLYIENDIFKTDVLTILDDTTSDFLNALSGYYSNSFSLEVFYDKRANILYQMYKVKSADSIRFHNIVECRDNVVTIIEKCMSLFPSMFMNKKCGTCGFALKRALPVATMSSVDFFETGIVNLQFILEKNYDSYMGSCLYCKEKCVQVYYSANSYLAVDVECFHERKNSNRFRNFVKKLPVKTKLCDIPKKLIFKNKKLELKGAVCFEGDPENESQINNVPHYEAYIFPSNGQCKLFNDLDTDVRIVSEEIEEKIAVFIYAEI